MQYWDFNENKPRGTSGFPIEFHHIDNTHPRYTMPYHWHMEHEIIRILDGEFHITIDNYTHIAKKDDIILIRDSLLHGGTPINCTYECLVIDFNTLIKQNPACREYIHFLTSPPNEINTHISSEHKELHDIIWKLFDEFYTLRKGYEFFVIGYIYQMLGQIYNEHLYSSENAYISRDQKRIQQFKKVFEYIESHYADVITIDDLSSIADMSPRYFYRIFYTLTHRSPIDYLNYYRIERACDLLVSSGLSIMDISHQCGFNDVSYFIKTFKRYKGVPPKKYQQGEFLHQDLKEI